MHKLMNRTSRAICSRVFKLHKMVRRRPYVFVVTGSKTKVSWVIILMPNAKIQGHIHFSSCLTLFHLFFCPRYHKWILTFDCNGANKQIVVHKLCLLCFSCKTWDFSTDHATNIHNTMHVVSVQKTYYQELSWVLQRW